MAKMCEFAWFETPITGVSNADLISWLVSFLNGAPYDDPTSKAEWDEFMAEVPNRSEEFQKEVDYIMSVL